MHSSSKLAYWEGLIIVGGLFGIVVWKLFTGGINLDYLLHGESRNPSGQPTPFVSPGRVQLLMTTVISALYYLLQVIHDPTVFPKIPTAWLVGLGGSQAIYLAGKAQSLLRLIEPRTPGKTSQ